MFWDSREKLKQRNFKLNRYDSTCPWCQSKEDTISHVMFSWKSLTNTIIIHPRLCILKILICGSQCFSLHCHITLQMCSFIHHGESITWSMFVFSIIYNSLQTQLLEMFVLCSSYLATPWCDQFNDIVFYCIHNIGWTVYHWNKIHHFSSDIIVGLNVCC